jgi:hypothetical protein
MERHKNHEARITKRIDTRGLDSKVMKYDYLVKDIYGNEVSCNTFSEATAEAKKLILQRPDCDPVIDQYHKDDELTGEYWLYRNNRFVKPKTLKELLS